MRKDSFTKHCLERLPLYTEAVADQGNVANRKISILTDAVRRKTFYSNSTCFDRHMQHIRASISCKIFLRHWRRGEKVQMLIFLWSFLQWVKRWKKKSLWTAAGITTTEELSKMWKSVSGSSLFEFWFYGFYSPERYAPKCSD